MSMVSEPVPCVANEKAVAGSLRNKKNQGKVPRKIHKAEREKLKRDHLNDLFLDLDHALEPARQNNGKACILGDATRLLQDLIAQVESLRKENAALVTESQYVTMEKNELRDDNTVLEAEISRLQNELQERMQSDSLGCNSTEAIPPTLPQPMITQLQMPPPPQPSIRPVYVIPLHQDLHPYPEAGTAKPPSHVKKPHARYPTPSDSWPLDLLSSYPRIAQEAQHNGCSSSSMSNHSKEGTDKASAGPCDKLAPMTEEIGKDGGSESVTT